MTFPSKLFLKGALLGSAITVMVIFAFGIWLQQSNRFILTGVGPWVANAVTTEFVGITAHFDRKVFAEFEFSAENMTNSDYSLPARSDAAFVRVRDGMALNHEEGLTWPSGKYLPPNRKVIVKFTVPFEFTETFTSVDANDKEKFAAFLGRRIKELDGFVILDQHTRYEIAFPMPMRELKRIESPLTK